MYADRGHNIHIQKMIQMESTIHFFFLVVIFCSKKIKSNLQNQINPRNLSVSFSNSSIVRAVNISGENIPQCIYLFENIYLRLFVWQQQCPLISFRRNVSSLNITVY